jgi:ferric-dicitrate binding protein FerR (iron transport regulator)
MTLELLVRHLVGQAAPSETDAVQRWLAASPDNHDTLGALRQVLGTGPKERQASDLDEVWRRIVPGLTASAPIRLVPVGGGRRASAGATARQWPFSHRRRSWLPAAAAAILVAGGAAAWRAAISSQPTPRPPADGPARVVATAAGQRLSFGLADGTLVTLAPASTLRVSPGYGGRDRLVHLEGEAAFTVIHDSSRPFIVRTARAEVHDLGTRFVVRSYPDEATAHVAVAEGRVSVRPGAAAARGDSVLLVPNDVARVAADGRVNRVRGVAIGSFFAWTEGRLVFRDTPLRAAAAQLGRWYDIDVHLTSDSMDLLPLTASFAEQPAAEALRLVAITLDLRLSQAGRAFTLSSR